MKLISTLPRNTLLTANIMLLSACNGADGRSSSPTQPNEPVVIAKKSINVDNLTNVFSQYLLYHYRVDVELPRLRNLVGTQTIDNGVAVNCSKRGTVIFTALASTITANYNSCETEVGAIYSGSIASSYAQGPVKTNLTDISNLNYQLSDDLTIGTLSGRYTDKLGNNARSSSFHLLYSNGTSSFEYTADASKTGSVDIKTTSISGNQHYTLLDMDASGTAVTPILSADDDSNLTITSDSTGAATVSLRNTKDGAVIFTRPFSAPEVDDMLRTARRINIK